MHKQVVYQTDVKGYYIGTDVAYDGLLPYGAVTTAPKIQEGYVPQWNGTDWVQVENHMGKDYWMPTDTWDDEPRKMAEYGAFPDEALFVAPEKPASVVQEELLSQFSGYIQTYLDDFARTRLYDNMGSACTYATSKNEIFKAEGQYCVDARDAVWATGYTIQNDVLSGARPMPTKEELLTLLPVLEWPTERPEGM